MRSLEIEGSKPKQFSILSRGKKRANFFDSEITEKFHTKSKYGAKSNRFDPVSGQRVLQLNLKHQFSPNTKEQYSEIRHGSGAKIYED